MSYQKITVHCGVGGNRTGIGDYFRRLDAAGRPASVCSYDDYGVVKELLDYRRRSGVPHIGVFRPNMYEFGENPNYDQPAESAARAYWHHFRHSLPPELANPHHRDFQPEYKQWTWLIWGNEGRRETIWENGQNGGDWWGQVAVTIAQLALAEGFRTLAFGFSAGTPDEDIWQTTGMRNYLRLCDAHPDKCGIALHEGADPKNPQPPFFGALVNQEWDITGRYQHMFRVCDAHNLRRPRIYISECAWFYRDAPDVGLAMQHVRQAARYYAQHPEVMGVSLWTTSGSGGVGEYGRIAEKVQKLIRPIADYSLSADWDGIPHWPDDVAHYLPREAGPVEPPVVDRPVDSAELGCTYRAHDNTIAGDRTPPGLRFKASWVLQNSGNAVWNGDFQYAYVERRLPDSQTHILAPLTEKRSYTLRELSGRDSVAPGDTVTLTLSMTAPTSPGLYATHWELRSAEGVAFGGTRWMGFDVAGLSVEPPPGAPSPVPTTGFQPGMNINPDAHAPYLDELGGLHWVRFVFKVDAQLDPNKRNLGAAFRHYDALIESYLAADVKVLLILNQETVWGNKPWESHDWNRYASLLAERAGKIAAHYAHHGNQIAYQIWNEGDSGEDNFSAIHAPAAAFAPVLDATADAIRQVAPTSPIVFGGLNTAPENAVQYVRTVQATLGGRLPVDALAYHPYGRYVDFALFNYSTIGRLSDALDAFKTAFPGLPLWITELGVANVTPIGEEHYADIARYMREVTQELVTTYADHVPVLLWFAWTDSMQNAGILTTDGQRKPHVYDAFVEMRQLGAGSKEVVFDLPAAFLWFESSANDLSAVPAQSSFACRWAFENCDTQTWDESYRLVYAPSETDAAPLTARESFGLAEVAQSLPVKPGETLVIELALRAPTLFGRHWVSRWEIRDNRDEAVGHLYVEITVTPPVGGGRTRSADMRFIDDVTFRDGTRVQAGREFSKQWRVRNTGERHWGDTMRLVYTGGDLAMARGNVVHRVPPAKPGDEIILAIPMIAPPARNGQPTRYTSSWRLETNHGEQFGDRLWAEIVATPPRPHTLIARFDDPTGWYSQRDPRWAGEALGHGRRNTIGSWGCLLTCFAMMLTAYGKRITPLQLNHLLRDLGPGQGFDGDAVQFIAPALILSGLRQGRNVRSLPDEPLPHTVWEAGVDPLQRIDEALAAGQVVIAQVDGNRANTSLDQHWVILTQRSRDGRDYMMLDPLEDADSVRAQPTSLLQRYGPRIVGGSAESNLLVSIKSALVYRLES